jgi:hypothetical protein
MYHEPMVGFAQHHGFRWIGPEQMNPMLAQADGYPRATENLMLYLVALWDRRLIDLVPSILVPILLVATYVIVRRFVASRVAALGLAAGFVLLPAIILQLRSTYVDVTFAVFLASAAAFLCRRDPTPADLWMGGLSLGLLGASKITGFVVVPLVGAVGLGILIASAVRRRRPSLACISPLRSCSCSRSWRRATRATGRSTRTRLAGRVSSRSGSTNGPLGISDMNVTPEQDRVVLRPADRRPAVTTRRTTAAERAAILIRRSRCSASMAPGTCSAATLGALVLLTPALPLLATIAISPARLGAPQPPHRARGGCRVVLRRPARRRAAESVVGALVIGAAITLC